MQQSRFQRTHFILMFFAFALGMILSNLLSQNTMEKKGAKTPVLMTYRGHDQTLEKLPEVLAQEYCKMLSSSIKEQMSILGHAALQLHVADFADRNKISFETAAERLFPVSAPDETELQAFFQENKRTLNKAYFEVKDDIVALLNKQRVKQARTRMLKKLVDQGDLIFFPDLAKPNCLY